MGKRTTCAAAAMIGAVLVFAVVLATCADAGAQDAAPARVTFASMDGRTKLVGYVFTPDQTGRAPARIRLKPMAATTPRPYRSVIRCGGACGRRWAMWRSWSTDLARVVIRKALGAAATISVPKRSTR